MILMQSVRDDTMAVSGFEHHTFMCSDCHDVERRLVFVRPAEQVDPEPVMVAEPTILAEPMIRPEPMTLSAAPSISPAATGEPAPAAEDEAAAAPGILTRVLAKLRGGRRAATSSGRPA
jgi:hypothetical protein